MEEHSVYLYLSSGNVIEAKYYDEDYDDIYDQFSNQKHEVVTFNNCSVFADMIDAIGYEEETE